jgi:TPR repeat protein
MKNQNFFKANKNYKQACDLRDGFSCNQIGIDYAKGIAIRKDIEKARSYFGLACDYEYKSGCSNYANMGFNWEYRSSSILYKLPKLIH